MKDAVMLIKCSIMIHDWFVNGTNKIHLRECPVDVSEMVMNVTASTYNSACKSVRKEKKCKISHF